MTPLSQFALLDAVVAGYKWRTCPASNSGTQPSHSKLYTNKEKNHSVLVPSMWHPQLTNRLFFPLRALRGCIRIRIRIKANLSIAASPTRQSSR